MKTLKTDVIIPTYRPGEEFEKLLERLSAQKYPINKILVMNTEKKFWKPSHLSEMLVQGCAMSLINIARAENECARADAKAMCLCKRARRNEQENIQRLLKFV